MDVNSKQLFSKTVKYNPPSSMEHQKAIVKKNAKNIFLPFFIVMLIHGNVSRIKATSLTRIGILTMLIILIITSEGLFFNFMYIMFKYDNDGSKSRRNIIVAFIWFLNLTLRIFFFRQSKKLKETTKKLAVLYSKVSSEKNRLYAFKVKIIIVIIIYEIVRLYHVFEIYCVYEDMVGYFHFGVFSTMYSRPFYILSIFLLFWSYIELAVTCYFCSVCFLLKETLLEFNKKLHGGNIKVAKAAEIYSEIIDLTSDINNNAHSILLIGFGMILAKVFSSTYNGAFIAKGFLSVFYLVRGVFMFCNIIFMATFGSLIINVYSQVQRSLEKLPVDLINPKNIRYALQINKTFAGFKLLNSITIDSSFLLSSVGCLVTYGILIATFSTNSSKDD